MARYNGSSNNRGAQNGFKSNGSAPNHMANGHSFGNPGSNEDGVNDYASNEMHFKMCKKIAQLTKVIYTLNTKADEHESIVEEIESKHEELMNKYFNDCQLKLTQAKSKIEDQKSLKDKILSLEAKIEGLNGTNEMHDVELKKLKQSSQDEITKLKISHSNTILNLGKEVETLRDKLETQTDEFSQLLHDLVKEKEKNLEDVRVLHDKALENLKMDHAGEIGALKDSMSQLESPEKIAELEKQISNLETLRQVAESKLDSELEKLRNQHENDVEKLRNDMQLEAMQATRNVRDSMTQKLKSREDELNDEIMQYKMKLEEKSIEIADLSQTIERQKLELSTKQGEGQSLSEEFNQMKKLMTDLETENTVLNNRVDSSQNELDQQIKEVASLKNSLSLKDKQCTEWEMKYQDGLMEKNVLEDKNKWLEGEVDSLNAKQNELMNKMGSDTVHLQTEMDNLRKELEEKLKNKSNEMVEQQNEHESAMQILKFEHEKTLHDELTKHEQELNKILSSKTELIDCKQEYERKISTMEQNFEKERKWLLEQIEKLQSESSAKLKKLQAELLKKNEEYAANGRTVRQLEEKVEILQKSLEDLQTSMEQNSISLSDNKKQYKAEKAEWDNLRTQLEESLLNMKQDHAQQLIVQEANLSSEWQTKLDLEIDKLTEMLSSENNKSLTDQLSRIESEKNLEISKQKEQFETSIAKLHKEIVDLERSLNDSIRNAKQTKDTLEGRLKTEKSSFDKELKEQKAKNADALSNIQKKMQTEIAEQIEAANLQLQVLEQRLNDEHAEEIEKLRDEFSRRMESESDSANQKLTQEIEHLVQTHNIRSEKLKNDLMSQHQSELEKLTEGFNNQIAYLKQELSQSNSIKTKLEKENNAKIAGLKEEVSHRNSLISNLEGELSQSKEALLRLGNELEFKDKVVQKIRAENEESIRKKQAELESTYKIEIDNLQAEKLREQRKLLDEFSRTKEMLQYEIRELKLKLRDAEQRYENRESRPEDIMQIQRLQQILEGEEEKLKRLVQEKEFFQRELVNRETNFNKVFNSNPNVGVLNPLATSKGKIGNGPSSISGKNNLFTVTANQQNSLTASSSQLPSYNVGGSSGHNGKLTTPPPGGRLEPLSSISSSQPNYRTPTPPKVPKKFL